MSHRPIMDAGPGINFFSIHKERLLFATLGALAIPEFVEKEIIRKSRSDRRFSAAQHVMGKVPPRLLEVLSDDVTDRLASVVHRMTGMPIERRTRTSKDLGETMVVAHAVVAAEDGNQVIVLIDDRAGRRMAGREAARLERMRSLGSAVGGISLVNTVTVLKKAAGREHVPDRKAMRELYLRLRELDDGLIPLENTGLMELPVWRR